MTTWPKGLKAVSDQVHKMGLKFVVWFEPERTFYIAHQAGWLKVAAARAAGVVIGKIMA